ncbi:MAG: hypothetical protein LBJ20_05520 [Candidatus Methanoplasma sp.]|nr:hypothetical protein [Candidatus Methanoplasma sp.]
MTNSAVYKLTTIILAVALLATGIYIIATDNKTDDREDGDADTPQADTDDGSEDDKTPSIPKQIEITVLGGPFEVISDGNEGVLTYNVGEVVKIRALSNPGYIFIGWYSPSGKSISNDTVYEFTATQDTTLYIKYDFIRDADFTVSLDKNVVGIQEGHVLVRTLSQHTNEVVEDKYIIGFESTSEPNRVFYGNVYTTVSVNIIEKMTIAHHMRYTDGTSTSEIWNWGDYAYGQGYSWM